MRSGGRRNVTCSRKHLFSEACAVEQGQLPLGGDAAFARIEGAMQSE
jgi:hypothetical protein